MENIQSNLVGLRRACGGEFGEANLFKWCDSLEEALDEAVTEKEYMWSEYQVLLDEVKEENEKLKEKLEKKKTWQDTTIKKGRQEMKELNEENLKLEAKIEELQDTILARDEELGDIQENVFPGYDEDIHKLKEQIKALE